MKMYVARKKVDIYTWLYNDDFDGSREQNGVKSWADMEMSITLKATGRLYCRN